MRKITAIGNVTKDATVKAFEKNGKSNNVINFDIACNESYFDKDKKKIEKTFYIKCVLWRENPNIAQHIIKGKKIYVEGLPEVEVYLNKEGKAVGSTRINVRTLEFLGGGNKNNQGQPAQSPQSDTTVPSDEGLVVSTDKGDDLPF